MKFYGKDAPAHWTKGVQEMRYASDGKGSYVPKTEQGFSDMYGDAYEAKWSSANPTQREVD